MHEHENHPLKRAGVAGVRARAGGRIVKLKENLGNFKTVASWVKARIRAISMNGCALTIGKLRLSI
jgi:hypothetical protein